MKEGVEGIKELVEEIQMEVRDKLER